jgi:hypothetical protein
MYAVPFLLRCTHADLQTCRGLGFTGMCASGRLQTDWDSLGELMPLRLEPYIRQVEPTQAMLRPSFWPRRAYLETANCRLICCSSCA